MSVAINLQAAARTVAEFDGLWRSGRVPVTTELIRAGLQCVGGEDEDFDPSTIYPAPGDFIDHEGGTIVIVGRVFTSNQVDLYGYRVSDNGNRPI